MKNDVDHLPPARQEELALTTRILMDEFALATSRATQPWKKNRKVQKIVLFGSYARGDWVDEPENGYQSDYDLLIIVSHADLTDIAEYWYVAEDKILRDIAVARPVNIIVHALDEVNRGLKRGEYFWVDIARDGIVLYDLPGSELATPMPLTAVDAYGMTSRYFADWLNKVDRRRFELAKRAYVEARYSAAYHVGNDDLLAIRSAVIMLRDTVETVSREWLDGLRQKAGL